MCSACASSAGLHRHAPAGETSCSSRSPPTSVVQTSLQLQEIVNINLGKNVKKIDHRLQTDKLQEQFLLKSRAVATDWASAVSAECDYTRCTHYLGTSIYYLDLLKCDWPHPTGQCEECNSCINQPPWFKSAFYRANGYLKIKIYQFYATFRLLNSCNIQCYITLYCIIAINFHGKCSSFSKTTLALYFHL